MAKTIQAIRGMNDCLPSQTAKWQQVEAVIRQVVASYGYQEIRTPIVESTDLFKRSIGEVTDIVEKEMYTFEDRNGDSLTLRPEGTASAVRAGNEHGLIYNQQQRLWYMGPMFRHERPQKGRYRQFHQFGVETYGLASADIDAEVILLSARLWKAFGIEDAVTLQLNSLGSNDARAQYKEALVAYLSEHKSVLDPESLSRLEKNPLRVLDSKNPDVQALVKDAPSLIDFLDDESTQHFNLLCKLLTDAGIQYEINPRLVRGLDYYNRTVFEWVTTRLGAQGTICAGGRYDGLVAQLGGRAAPGVGFALGLERLVLLLETLEKIDQSQPSADIYVAALGDDTKSYASQVAEQLRDVNSEWRVMLHCGGGNLKKQLKRADNVGASIALLIGSDEMASEQVTLKPLRGNGEQRSVTLEQLPEALNSVLQQ